MKLYKVTEASISESALVRAEDVKDAIIKYIKTLTDISETAQSWDFEIVVEDIKDSIIE